MFHRLKRFGAFSELPDSREQVESDEALLARMLAASNGDKFRDLYYRAPTEAEDWSQRDAQLAQFIAYYTDNHEQALRLFRGSALYRGTKGGYSTVDKYEQDYLLRRTFGAQWAVLAPEREAWRQRVEDGKRIYEGLQRAQEARAREGAVTAADIPAPAEEAPQGAPADLTPPPGLLYDLTAYGYNSRTTQCFEASLAGAIAMMAGICGRQYQTITGAGLAQYVVIVGRSGIGKEVANSLIDSVANAVPVVEQMHIRGFLSGGSPQSQQALLKHMGGSGKGQPHPCTLFRFGEIGHSLTQWLAPDAKGPDLGMQRVLLELYGKNSASGRIDPITFSDNLKNTEAVQAPSASFLGDTTPSQFFDAINRKSSKTGMMSRLTVLFSNLRSSIDNPSPAPDPSPELVNNIKALVMSNVALREQNRHHNVPVQPDAAEALEDYRLRAKRRSERLPDDEADIVNRVHLRAMKLATLSAVGRNWLDPCVMVEDVRWACATVDHGSDALLERFASGDADGTESRAMAFMLKAAREYLATPPNDRPTKYYITNCWLNTRWRRWYNK